MMNTNDSFPDKKKSNRELSEIFGVTLATVNKIRKTYCEEGLETALNRKTWLMPESMPKITGDFEAHVIASLVYSNGKRPAFYCKYGRHPYHIPDAIQPLLPCGLYG
ncbi:MAG: helix-turn-helix domain-containing protein [Lachnospiraceae bacterium]|nr:helix-turn-helix domain-containing protein [Lachnospiraceae bacterium]